MTKQEMRKLCAKMDADYKGQRPLPNGRNFVYWEHTETNEDRELYRSHYDDIKWDTH